MSDIQRIYKFDNIKFICILLVVVGHFAENYCDSSVVFKTLFFLIYSFHMPMFIFIYGIFTKKYRSSDKFNFQKFTFFIVLGYLLKFIIYIEKILFLKKANFYWFKEDGIPWFMFVLAAYMLIAFLVKKVSPIIVIIGSFVIGCLSGYISIIGDTLCASRILVYMPFFFLGYYLTPEKVISFTAKTWVQISSGILALGYIVFSCIKIDYVYGLRRLFTGKNAYNEVLINNCGVQHRVLTYIISIVLCVAIISIIPNINISGITKMGSNTLSVFFWHMPIKNILFFTGFMNALEVFVKNNVVWIIVVVLLATAICIILSVDIVGAPLKVLKKFIYKLSSQYCKIILSVIAVVGLICTFMIK